MLHQEIVASDSSCYTKFLFALKSASTRRQYPKRFEVFLDFLKVDGKTIEEKAIHLYHMIKVQDVSWIENKLIEYFLYHNKRAETGEISVNTIRNYYKPIKLFFEMNNILINWKILSKGIHKGDRISSDRPPLMSEIQKLMEFSDTRTKTIISVMVSSGIRVGSWDYLKWKHVKPIYRNQNLVAAKIDVYNTKTKRWYYSFITPEAYNHLEQYIKFRENFGEKITPESWLMRDTWQIKSQKIGKNFLGQAEKPIQFRSSGIRMMMNKAWKIQGIRQEKTENNGKRFEFKSLHGFRKFFETECQKVMKPLNISYLMSHDTGITQHYFKPKEEELLDDYLKAVDLLTINEENKLKSKINELTEKEKVQDYLINKKLMEKDEEIQLLQERDLYNKDAISNLSDKLAKLIEEVDRLKK
ncbi:MAG: hypothetical protein DA328_06295 [Nitrososphaeraceae archaeon]|nr:hypothetical protein [Nitrososphaeraceae archaeon]